LERAGAPRPFLDGKKSLKLEGTTMKGLEKFWKIYRAIRRTLHRRELRAAQDWRERMIKQIEAMEGRTWNF
jgi:hypothetical protein